MGKLYLFLQVRIIAHLVRLASGITMLKDEESAPDTHSKFRTL